MLPGEFEAQFKTQLTVLVSLWADARKQKSLVLLGPFRYNVNTMTQSVATFALYDLQDKLSEISKACQSILSEKKSFRQIAPDIDALMNELIVNAQKTPNPLLIEDDQTFIFESIGQSTNVAAKKKRRRSIAIIDGDKSSGLAITALISEFNFNVEYFSNIKELNDRLSAHQLDLVLLDILLPGVSTNQVFEFASTLNRRDIKVISYSGLFNFETRLAAVRAGIADFIVKPTSILGIVEKIRRVLNQQQTRKYQIVFIDDQKFTGEFYQQLLEDAQCEVHFMNSVQLMFNSLDDIHPDLFIFDMNMPLVDGLEATKMVRQQKQFDFTPIIILTADEQLETKLLALQGGADDVIAKSTPSALVIQLLLTRLKRSLSVREFVSKDSLTGVLNHGQIMEAAMTNFRLSQRQNSSCSIAMLDIDRFKAVNDTFGHAAGDKVLSGLGQLLSRSLRNTDRIGRYGGEEFMIVLVGSTPEESIRRLNSIKEEFAASDVEFRGKVFRCTFSIGLANLAQNENLPQAVNQADQALYASKEGGRNRITIFDTII
ncbi:MAG: diguanylate cyclase (GGDEF)-like protein [Gammaproteobacteria bacterium]|jgi:diguanylate cyclase (GGDEF)-like protein